MRRAVLLYHALLLDGLLIGHWRHGLKRDEVLIETHLHRAFGRVEAKALAAAVERYGRFVGLRPGWPRGHYGDGEAPCACGFRTRDDRLRQAPGLAWDD